MSFGCGTMAGPSGHNEPENSKGGKGVTMPKGTKMAASGNGKQHMIPAKATGHFSSLKLADDRVDKRLKHTDIEAYWDKNQPTKPTRVWGAVKKPTIALGGESRVDGEPDFWSTGEYWNVDSNIRIWGEHEIKRQSAQSSHDVMRHDQVCRLMLEPHAGAKDNVGKNIVQRQSMSGMVSPDSCYLEAYGFDLGFRDRQGAPVPQWRPCTTSEQFRSQRSYNRNLSRMSESFRTLRRADLSCPQISMSYDKTERHPLSEASGVRAEDLGGEAGMEKSTEEDEINKTGKTHGSRSCRFWDRHDHAAKREAAKLSCGTYTPYMNGHPENYPHKDHLELNPASVYTLKYKKGGDAAVRDHVPPSQRCEPGSFMPTATQWNKGDRGTTTLKRTL